MGAGSANAPQREDKREEKKATKGKWVESTEWRKQAASEKQMKFVWESWCGRNEVDGAEGPPAKGAAEWI